MSTARNTFYNLLGGAAPMLVALVTVPLYVRFIGAAEYGILTIAWLLMGYSVYAELGMGQGVANEIAKLEDAQAAQRSTVFWTGFWTALFSGLIVGLLITGLAYVFVPSWSNLEPGLRAQLLQSLPWLILASPLATGITVLSSAVESRQFFKHANIVQSSGWILIQGLPLVPVFTDHRTLPWLIGFAVLARVIILFVWFVVLTKLLPLSWRLCFDRSKMRFLLTFGGWVTLSNIAETLLSSLDRWLAGVFLNAEAVAYYAVPANLATRTMIFPVALMRTFFPKFSASSTDAALREIVPATIYLGRALAPLMGVGIIIIDPFLKVWVGSDFAHHAFELAPVLVLAAWFRAPALMPDVLLRATRRPHIMALTRLVELPLLFIAAWVGFKVLGLLGLAWAWCARVVLDALWLWIKVGRLIEVARGLLPSAAGLVLIYLMVRIGDSMLPYFEAILGSAGVVILLIAWTLWMDRIYWLRLWFALIPASKTAFHDSAQRILEHNQHK